MRTEKSSSVKRSDERAASIRGRTFFSQKMSRFLNRSDSPASLPPGAGAGFDAVERLTDICFVFVAGICRVFVLKNVNDAISAWPNATRRTLV
jgi:hypothetical protein